MWKGSHSQQRGQNTAQRPTDKISARQGEINALRAWRCRSHSGPEGTPMGRLAGVQPRRWQSVSEEEGEGRGTDGEG